MIPVFILVTLGLLGLLAVAVLAFKVGKYMGAEEAWLIEDSKNRWTIIK